MSFIHKKRRKAVCGVLAGVLALLLCGCNLMQEEIVDSHVGEVCVSNGMGGEMWVPLYEELAVSDFKAEDFYAEGEYINYSGEDYITKRGIDVSEHQQIIDWAAVKEDGVEFAIIRAGYRGCSEGVLNTDDYFKQNIEGALSQGIEVGIYFFSQAINTEEAMEEAIYTLNLIESYNVTLPIFYDWELVTNVGETRCDNMTGEEITDNCLAFCSTIERHGHEAGVYFYRALAYREYDLGRMGDLMFWAAAPGETPDFYYKHSIWQYSYTAQISGIEGPTDLDIMFIEKAPQETLPAQEDNQQGGTQGDLIIQPPAVATPSA